MSARRIFARPARIAAIAPYLWMVLFFLVPFGFVLKISLSQTAIAQPPYLPVFDLTQGLAAIKAAFAALSLDNFRLLVSDDLYVLSYLRSLVVAAVSTSILLLIGYPIAYGMARLPQRWQSVAMMLVIVPFWTSFLIRIYAWINILQHDGLLNKILLALHLVSAPVVWLSTDSAMYLGIVYSYLPFMILPLYATLAKMEPALLEAAGDLGASPRQAFWLVTFPLSLPGVGAGVLLCFIPIVGEFVIPDLLAGSDSLMIGQTLWLEFFTNKDWPVASAAAVLLLLLLVRRWCCTTGCSAASSKAGVMASASNKTLALQRRLAGAGAGVSVSADRDPGDLFVQRLAAGDGVGRLVAALVRRVLQRPRHARRGLDEFPRGGDLGHDGDAARHARRGGAVARRALQGPHAVFRHALCAAGDARSHHRTVAAAAVRGAQRRARLLDRDDRPHHADHVLRRRGGAVAARRARPQPGGGGDGSRLRSGARVYRRDAAADRARDRRRLDAGLHAVARRSRDRELHHRPRFGDAADPDLFGSAARRETRDQRDLHAGDRADRGGHRGGVAGLETVERARRERRAVVGFRHPRAMRSGSVTRGLAMPSSTPPSQ